MRARVQTVIFYCLMVVATWAAVELFAVAATGIKYGHLYSPSGVKSLAESVVAGPQATAQPSAEAPRLSGAPQAEVIHPYIGVVLDPDRDPTGNVSKLGFRSGDAAEEIWQDSDTLIVGIFGGSFAFGVHQQSLRIGGEKIAQGLGIRNRKIVTVNFSKGGYKQPQQLMTLAYLLSLGARFDIVINIDGFNEVALPPGENIPRGVNPFYPRMWHLKAQKTLDPEAVRKVGYMEYLDSERKRRASQLLDHSLYRSALLSLIWRVVDQRLAASVLAARQEVDRSAVGTSRFMLTQGSLKCLQRANLPKDLMEPLQALRDQPFNRQAELQEVVVDKLGAEHAAEHRRKITRCTEKTATSFTALGPKHPVASDDLLYRDLAGMWERSSVEMKALCDAHGIRYYHFLQPNQYVEGSKPLSAEERRIAINEAQNAAQGVAAGYPRLWESGQRLQDRGVAFTDLTMLYEDVSGVLYVDDCCHVNWAGYRLVLDKILEVIAADL